jgi:hypothetical protein
MERTSHDNTRLALICALALLVLFAHAHSAFAAPSAGDPPTDSSIQDKVGESGAALADTRPRPTYNGLYAYFGDLHQHTGFVAYYEDGTPREPACGSPLQVLEASEASGNDFQAMTEHQYGLRDNNPWVGVGLGPDTCERTTVDKLPGWIPGMTRWQYMQSVVAAQNRPGQFVTFMGMEWTFAVGHINLINIASAPFAELELNALYNWLSGQPQSVVAQFNHPTMDGATFNDFAYHAGADQKLGLVEGGKHYHYHYPLLFNHGWQVGSVGYNDSHYASGGLRMQYGAFAVGLTREDLIQAFRASRTFASENRTAVALLANGVWMGSIVPPASSLDITVFAHSTGGEAITRIDLLTEDYTNNFVTYRPPEPSPIVDWHTQVDTAGLRYLYAQITTADGARTWSAPIFIGDGDQLRSDPSWLSFTAYSSGADPASQSISLFRRDGYSTGWTVAARPTWLTVSPSSGLTLPVTLTLTADKTGLPAGNHDDVIRIQTEGSPASAWLIGVHLGLDTGSAVAKLTLDPYSVAMELVESSAPTTAHIHVAAGEDLAWETFSDAAWLTPLVSGGTGPLDLPVQLRPACLTPGHYTSHLNVAGGANVQTCTIELTVKPSNPQTITIQQGQSGYSGTRDSLISQWEPDRRYGLEGYLKLRNTQASLLRFDIPLPTGVRVWSATLSLYAAWYNANEEMSVDGHQMLRDWVEEEVTWNQRSAGDNWAGSSGPVPDQDYQERVKGSVELASATIGWLTMDITSMAQEWISDPTTNYGVLLRTSSQLIEYTLASSESFTAEQRPKLSIEYYVPSSCPSTTPSPTYTATPVNTTTSTATRTATPTDTTTPTPTDTATPTDTTTPTPTDTATPTDTPTQTATLVPTPSSIYIPVVLRFKPPSRTAWQAVLHSP